jgi:hypothetical protein
MMAKGSGVLRLLPAAALLAGCADPELAPPDSELLDPSGQFTLYVSNQSFEISPVDIQVSIDGEVVVREYFEVGNQHSWKTFVLDLSGGTHRIDATSNKGGAELSEAFEVKGNHWAVIDYWYYPKVTGGAGPTPRQFTFMIQDEPIRFE